MIALEVASTLLKLQVLTNHSVLSSVTFQTEEVADVVRSVLRETLQKLDCDFDDKFGGLVVKCLICSKIL